jgi:hypothetical protein
MNPAIACHFLSYFYVSLPVRAIRRNQKYQT